MTKELEESFIELYIFNSALSLMRKTLMPQCGAGSKSSEYYLHKILSNFVINKAKEISEDYDYEDDEGIKETLFFFDD